jgi:DNA modification methylase
VVDPCAGSFVVLDACLATNRNFLGVDLTFNELQERERERERERESKTLSDDQLTTENMPLNKTNIKETN